VAARRRGHQAGNRCITIDIWFAFLAGMFVGANLGAFIAAILRIGVRADEQLDREAEALRSRLAGPVDPNSGPPP